MTLFHHPQRNVGLRFPMGTRGFKQTSLRLVGAATQPTCLQTKVDPTQPQSSFERLQEKMIADGETIRDAMNNKIAEIEENDEKRKEDPHD